MSPIKRINFLLTALLLSACTEGQKVGAKQMSTSPTTSIQIFLGQPVADSVASSPLPFDEDCLAPVGICWYEINKRFSEPDLPSVTLSRNGSELLQLDDVGRISTVVEEAQGRLVEQVTLNVRGLPDNSPHAEQKAFVYQLLNHLQTSGWAHFYRFAAPRISGSEASKINTADKVLGKRVLDHPWFDPRYEASLEQWLSSSNTYHWYFYQDHTYLHVTVQRSNSRSEPEEKGTYLISLELLTENAYWPQHFSEEQQKDWQQLLPALLDQYHEQRSQLEAEAQAAGIEIEDSYENPPIKALEP